MLKYYSSAPLTYCLTNMFCQYKLPPYLAEAVIGEKHLQTECRDFSEDEGADDSVIKILTSTKSLLQNYEKSEIKQVFEKHDQDKSGSIDKTEFRACLEALGYNYINQQQVDTAYK